MTFAQLLVVQAHDSAIVQLLHRRETLAERRALELADEERAHLVSEREAVEADRHLVTREQKRLEDDVAIVADRLALENERLYSGAVTAIKDLQALQSEIAQLNKRQSAIEDDVLIQMEAGEPLDDRMADIDRQLEAIAVRRGEIEVSLASSEAEIDGLIDVEQQGRDASSAEIDPALMSEYERVRAECGGIGASRLTNKTCEGCHLELSAVEYDRVRKEPADALILHECGRILVRT